MFNASYHEQAGMTTLIFIIQLTIIITTLSKSVRKLGHPPVDNKKRLMRVDQPPKECGKVCVLAFYLEALSLMISP